MLLNLFPEETTPAHVAYGASYDEFAALRLRATRRELLGSSVRLGNYLVLVKDTSSLIKNIGGLLRSRYL